jgi:SAM-dependent methyltransferase
VTVLDIVPGDNVTIVGDAHELTSHFPPDAFDGIYSVSVFEHLLMPWKVVLEMNRVLRVGGKCLIHTHQTLGMHDLPWDFWRYSDSSWDALFNHRTGFRVVERAMDSEQYVIPFFLRPEKIIAEKSAGFEGSCVVVEKIGPTCLEWDVSLRDAVSTTYPTHKDANRA